MICVLLGFLHFFCIFPVAGVTFASTPQHSVFGDGLLLAWFLAELVLLVYYLLLAGRLNALLGKSAASRVAFALLIVFANLVAVLVVNNQATKRLRRRRPRGQPSGAGYSDGAQCRAILPPPRQRIRRPPVNRYRATAPKR
jgi:hypothetical protein